MEVLDKPVPRSDPDPPPSDVVQRSGPEEVPNVREVLGKFWARRWLIVASIGFCAVLAFVTAKLVTPIYTGDALVLIKPVHGGEPVTNASLQAAIEGGPEAVPTEAIVLQSRTLAKQTIVRLNLDRDPEFAPRPDNGVAAASPVPAPAGSAEPRMIGGTIVDAFLGQLRVSVEPHSNVIRVSFKSSRATLAALVPNTLVQLYIDRLTSDKNRALADESARLDRVILPMLRQKMYDSEADRKIYERYVARSDEVHGDMGQARADASLLSAADVPRYPSFPKTRLVAAIGAGLGAGLGIVLVMLIDLLSGGLRTTEQVENALGIKCLGSVPRLEPGQHQRLQTPLGQPQDGAFGQAIRGIQLKLRRSSQRTGGHAILVTSAVPGEGKTWTAVSVAASLAADGFRVALVDCDLHRPNLHRSLDGARAPGLTDYFAATTAFADIVHTTGDGIKYVPAGAAAAKDAWRVKTDRLLPIIDQLAKECAFIIIDSPPVLAISETLLLAQSVDHVLLVVKWQATRAAVARHALRQLREAGAETAAVLSMVDVKRAAQFGDPAASVYKRLESYYLHSPRA